MNFLLSRREFFIAVAFHAYLLDYHAAEMRFDKDAAKDAIEAADTLLAEFESKSAPSGMRDPHA